MELVGEQLIRAPRPTVWAAINDPDILSRCIPGCEEVIAESDTERSARVLLKIGPVRARFSGRLVMADVQAPARCRMIFEGKGGAAGFAKGEAAVSLEEEGGHTRLQYTAAASVGGKLGQIGGRLIEASSKKLADEFFTSLNALLSAPEDGAHAPAAVAAAASGASPEASSSAAPGHAPAVSPRPAQHASGPAPLFAPGWSGELARVLWFALGVGSALLGTYILR